MQLGSSVAGYLQTFLFDHVRAQDFIVNYIVKKNNILLVMNVLIF